ncbi:MAG: trigger factor, partial [Trebonia sp.]
RAAAEGDRVTVDHEGRIDGSIFAGGKGTGLRVTIGARQILPEIEQGLIGMSAGDTKTVAARFPDDYGAKAVAGKQVEFVLAVTEVEQSALPALDEEFAKGFGVDGLEALRTEIRKNMEREVAEAVRTKLRDQVTDVLYRENPLELPRTMIDEQISALQAQMLRRLGSTDPQQLPAPEAFESNARRRVALGLLIGEIVRSQQLKVDRARVEERLDALAANSTDPQELRRQYLASHEAMQQLESVALEDEAIDWVLSQVKIVERPSSFAEVTGSGQRG